MKIDEAISLLKQYIDYNNHDIPDFYTMEEAIKVIIEALKQEPCEDVVSRQAVLDTIGNVPDYDDGMVWEALSHAQRDVALLSPVTPQPKMGKWEYVQYEGFCGSWHCSECSYKVYRRQTNYCPNCGAKMQEVEND